MPARFCMKKIVFNWGFMACWLMVSLAIFACEDSNLRRGSPAIQVSPEQLDFGSLNVGDSAPLSLTILNNGTAVLEIQNLQIRYQDAGSPEVFTIDMAGGSAFGPNSLPLSIGQLGAGGPGQIQIDLSFSPFEHIPYQAELVIDCNDNNSAQIIVPLTGTGAVPDILISPPLLDFGGVGLNSSSSLSLNISNEGEAALYVGLDDISLESGDEDSPFLWLGQNLTLGPGEQDTIEILYAPKTFELDNMGQVIPDTDTLLLASNDPDESPVSIPLEGFVSDNLPPVAGVKIVEVKKLDETLLEDVCAAAPVDTIRFEGKAVDPDGSTIQGANLRWRLEGKPNGSTRSISIPSEEDQRFWPSFKADLAGEYVVCMSASDAEGNRGTYDVEQACSCEQANAAEDYSCPCVRFSAFPREDIRVELTWDILGPDLDLHLVAPTGDFCSPTRDCRTNETATACVAGDTMALCRVPNCDPVAAGCLSGQECYDPDDAGPEPPGCWWETCSGTDCYWNARRPDWGVMGDYSDDPVHAIDCTGGCRAENINLNNPAPGDYRIMVNYWEYSGSTIATVRIYFKGDQFPSAELTKELSAECQTWNVAMIEWVDHNDHPVIDFAGASSEICCD